MNNHTKREIAILFCILLFAIIIISNSCTSGQREFWYTETNGYFHTNDLERAQKKIPFSIILPEYLPNELDVSRPYRITGPISGVGGYGVEVNILFVNDNFIVSIIEENERWIMEPNPELNPEIFEIAGIKVIRQDDVFPSKLGFINGFEYDWNQHDLTFSVSIFSYSHNEGIKIVESMISQTTE